MESKHTRYNTNIAINTNIFTIFVLVSNYILIYIIMLFLQKEKHQNSK